MNEYEIIWKNVKYYEWLWWNCIENLYAPKDLECPKVSTFLQNMKKIVEYEKNYRIWWN